MASKYLPELSLKYKKGEVLKSKITCSADIANYFRQIMDSDMLDVCESMVCMYLNRNNQTIGWFKVSQGGINGTIIDNRLILATGLNCLASAIIICHNHPSGNIYPSDADKAITKKLIECAKLMDMPLLDHIILTEDSYFSFGDEGLL